MSIEVVVQVGAQAEADVEAEVGVVEVGAVAETTENAALVSVEGLIESIVAPLIPLNFFRVAAV
jgi:hypothetical protein